MAVTHVVRGDDHISNTPKQVLLYRALGAPVPAFAHVPLILGPDKKRLSKRHGATSVGEYEKQGYLPEAMVNFLALLGWSPGSDEEVFTRDELVEPLHARGYQRRQRRVQSGEARLVQPAAHHADVCRRDPLEDCGPISTKAGLARAAAADPSRTAKAIDLVKPRARKLTDLVSLVRPFIADEIERDPAAVAKHLSSPELGPLLDAWRDRLSALEPFAAADLEAALRSLAEERGVKAGTLIHATRVAVTGQAVSPGIFEVLEVMGRDRVVSRLGEIAAARR